MDQLLTWMLRSRKCSRGTVFLLVSLIATLLPIGSRSSVDAFSTKRLHPTHSVQRYASTTPTSTDGETITSSHDDNRIATLSEQPQLPCFWKPSWKGGKWQPRIHLNDLQVGQKLRGSLVQELLDGKTGPKLYFDVGIGTTDSKGRWSIVNGMLRLERAKQSVVRKRTARLRQKDVVDLWVSRVQVGCARLEVCLDEAIVQKYQDGGTKIPVTSLPSGKEVQGRVMKILPYGVLVDVGANRLGLLHIRRVRELYGKYIDKEQGLIEAGLEKGAQVRLQVDSVERRRLSLDFTDDVKNEGKAELEAKNTPVPMEKSDSRQAKGANTMSADELAQWAAFAAQSGEENLVEVDDEDDGDESDDYDEYDEEREIEDSLGLGYY